jgi:hypothetical protein
MPHQASLPFRAVVAGTEVISMGGEGFMYFFHLDTS